MVAAAGDEPVDVVDDDDRVIATVTRAEMRARRLQHRAVFVLVTGPDGRWLVHRRSDDKDVWPGRWDLAVGGVVGAGETYAAAAAREVAEEIGFEGAMPVEIGGGRYVDDDVAVIGRCFRVDYDEARHGPLRFADGEVVEARWVTPDELDTMVAHHPFVPDSLVLLRPLWPLL
jgi:isopentenyldiphosphate isomerase